MLFNSYVFIGAFLPVVLLGFFALPGQYPRLLFVVGASYAFYAYARRWFPLLMLADTGIAFGVGLALARPRARRSLWLAGGIAGVLGLLVYFKYAHFLGGDGLDVFTALTGRGLPSAQQFLRGIVLPVGISFFTFESISYMVDVYRGDLTPERNPLRFAYFISFFPHLIAGPIVRYGKLAPQLVRRYQLDWDLFSSGLLLFALGLAKKVLLADSLAGMTDSRFASVGSLGLWGGWLAVLGYSFQIYFDFSGYCDMALGLARMVGIELPWNFNRPYRAGSPREFWRRWNVTLSQWLRDYLYIPLGGSRTSAVRRDVNLVVTMGLGGLWHGAAGNFVLWGLYHGGLLVGNRHLGRLPLRLPRVLAIAVTFYW